MASVWSEGVAELNTIAIELVTNAGRVGAKGSMVLRASALRVEALAKQLCPVDSGDTRNSIDIEYEGDGRTSAMSAEIGPDTWYAPFVEWGTSRMAPRAFMGPALDRIGPEFVAAVEAIAEPLGKT